MYIRPGHETLVSIIGEKTITTDTALQRFDPESRDCYDENEFNLKHFRNKTGHRYSIDNCLYESLVERIIELYSVHCYMEHFIPITKVQVNIFEKLI